MHNPAVGGRFVILYIETYADRLRGALGGAVAAAHPAPRTRHSACLTGVRHTFLQRNPLPVGEGSVPNYCKTLWRTLRLIIANETTVRLV